MKVPHFFYNRYVDNIFCLFKCETDAECYLNFLNRQHPNIKFTIEKEKNNQLPFLDILNNRLSNKLVTSVYRKRTYTGLLTNYNSFTSPNYKKGLIKTLIDRTFRINIDIYQLGLKNIWKQTKSRTFTNI